MTTSFRPEDRAALLLEASETMTKQQQLMMKASSRHLAHMQQDHGARTKDLVARAQQLAADMKQPNAASPVEQWQAYVRDAGQRMVLMLEALNARAEQDDEHEAAGTPPVLIYDYEIVMDGKDFPEPCNYRLLNILPPEGVVINSSYRPYIIIDPRAGHGAGIGGFKQDSQVGVALRGGHPVYFVAFGPHPEKGQNLTDVMHAEAEFIREVMRRHPDSELPVVVGNCQGGWAALLLAAANPDITGPVVLNGSPVSTWSGRVGENPMRYNGGLLGGVVPALLMADMNYGELDGAHLVSNFEMLDPARNYIGKYYDLWNSIDSGRERFLEFERWWGGYHFLAEEEIRWIVEQLFIGNRVARNEARLERGRVIDIKQIRSPIVVFASHGDNITPPQQALNWIIDTYADEREITVRGQRIVYMVHEKVGHLGIFVSASVAKREHNEISSTLRTIETLPPGLYEMVVDEVLSEGGEEHFAVSFHERSMKDLEGIDDGRNEETPAFAAVSRASELGSELYQMTLRPFVQAMSTPEAAKLMQQAHPGRATRQMFGNKNPLMRNIAAQAKDVSENREPLADANIFKEAEKLSVDMMMQSIDLWRDMRDMMVEQSFFGLWSSPWARLLGDSHNFERTRKDPKMLRYLPEVEQVLAQVDRGGYPEAVVRILMMLVETHGSVRRDRLEIADRILSEAEPFRTMGTIKVAKLLHEQSLISEFDFEAGLASLPHLLKDPADRRRALATMHQIVGPLETMEPAVEVFVHKLYRVLGEDLPSKATPASQPAAMLTGSSIPTIGGVQAAVAPEDDATDGSGPARKAVRSPTKTAA